MDRNKIIKAKELRKNGYSFSEIGLEMLISKSQAAYLCSLNPEDEGKCAKTTEEKICELVKKCSNINEVCKILGHKGTNTYYTKIKKVIEKYNIDVSHFNKCTNKNTKRIKKELKDILQKNVEYCSSKLKQRLIKEGIKEHKCEKCGRDDWDGIPIPLELHHINGDRNDNRLKNLQILCCNCHALTENHSGKKNRKEHNKCKVCGEEISRNATYCRSCYNKAYKKNNHSNKVPITIEKLLDDFKECGSFEGVGKKNNVSGNTIKKWCNKYDLPDNSAEMRKYIKSIFGDIKWKFNKGNTESLLNYNKTRFKPICLLTNNGEVEKTYYSNQEIEYDGYCPSVVRRVCNGKILKHHGRKFIFLDENRIRQ